ncbi:hypothetical protein GALMADRAFT_225567 [Galerina marginata CBS 339.88]|uniref:Uncharacterized protein n=1 Tax=Galerina marginata (strain CBS 339.88) TaxID=685588 RepID=A0A067T079_GALM3|nr:hypothetical protein GALMADRAFT_225567 [Galerina marginata CBS 339.88]
MTFILDDRDPHISYRPGGWFTAGNVGSEYNATTIGSNTIGDVASLTFTGKRVSVWGTLGSTKTPAPTSVYIVDNLPAVTFIPTLQPWNQYLQVFFQSDELSPSTSHTLVIKNMGPGTNDSILWLDYIQISPPDSMDAVLFSAPTPSLLTLSTPPPSTPSPSNPPSSTPLPSTPSTPTHSTIPPLVTASSTPKWNDLPAGVIVGATLGGLAFLAIFAVILVSYLRMKSKARNKLIVSYQLPQSSSQSLDSSVNFGRQPPQPPPYQSSVGIPVAHVRDHIPSSKISPISTLG